MRVGLVVSALALALALGFAELMLPPFCNWYGGPLPYRIERLAVSEEPARWAGLERAFDSLFADGLEGDVAEVAVFHRGREVLALRGVREGATVPRDPLFVLFSSTKVIESLVVAMLVDRQLLEYDAPIARYWPEFGQAGKDAITVAHLMTHSAGLFALDAPLDLVRLASAPRGELTAALAAARAAHEPGARVVYHPLTRGLYVSELVRRVDRTQRSFSAFVAEEILAPLGLARDSLTIGYDELDEPTAAARDARVVAHTGLALGMLVAQIAPQLVAPRWLWAPVVPTHAALHDAEIDFFRAVLDSSSVQARGIALRGARGQALSTPAAMARAHEFRARELASASGMSGARPLARVASELARGGGALLSADGLARALAAGDTRVDEYLFSPVAYTACGWGADRFGSEGLDGFVGWAGAGGSVFVFHRELELGFAYVPSHLNPRLRKTNGVRLLAAVTEIARHAAAANEH